MKHLLFQCLANHEFGRNSQAGTEQNRPNDRVKTHTMETLSMEKVTSPSSHETCSDTCDGDINNM